MPRLIEHLRATGLSSREARDLMAAGKVTVRGVPSADEGRAVDPAEVAVRPDAVRLRPGRDLVLLDRDEQLAVVWKPPGLLSTEAPGRRGEPDVAGVVRRLLGAAFVVHRLDEETSGVMLVGRTEEAQRRLKDLLAEHRVERRYLALVRGVLPAAPRTVRTLLVRDRGDGRRGSATGDAAAGGKEAVTHLRRLEALGRRASLVEARLETGRTHQVRIHLAEAGHPVLGDRLYGGPGVGRAAPRLALHACALGFVHPFTGEERTYDVPLADDLEVLRRALLRPGRPGGGRRRDPRRRG